MRKFIFTIIFVIVFAFASCTKDEPKGDLTYDQFGNSVYVENNIETTLFGMIDLKASGCITVDLSKVNENEEKYVMMLPFYTWKRLHMDQNNLNLLYYSINNTTDIKLSGDNLYLGNNPNTKINMYVYYVVNKNDTTMNITEVIPSLNNYIYNYEIKNNNDIRTLRNVLSKYSH